MGLTTERRAMVFVREPFQMWMQWGTVDGKLMELASFYIV